MSDDAGSPPGKRTPESFYEQGADFMTSASSYAANRPPLSNFFAGKKFTLNVDDGAVRIRHDFHESKAQLTWEILSGDRTGERATNRYEAFEMSEGIYFLSFLAGEEESIAMAVDFTRNVATTYQGRLPEKASDSQRVQTTISSAVIEGLDGKKVDLHARWSLAGTRFKNTYNESGEGIEYEHIYLTSVYKTWLGVKGPQAGQADTEEYSVFKLAESVYFVSWTEKLLCTQMSFMFNFDQLRSVGQVFGLSGGDRVHQTIGAKLQMIHSPLLELKDARLVDAFSE